MTNQLLPALAAATVAFQGLVADSPQTLNLDRLDGLRRGEPVPEQVTSRASLSLLSAPPQILPDVAKWREALSALERLEEGRLIGPRMGALLRVKVGDPNAALRGVEHDRIPQSLLGDADLSSVQQLERAVIAFRKSETGRTFTEPAVRAAVAIGFFTEGGIQGVITYLSKVEQLATLSDFRTHLETDKPYSIAWLHQRLRLFDAEERRFLEVEEKLPRAEATLKAFYRDVAHLPSPVLDHLTLRQVIAPENLLALASMGESKGYNSMNQGTRGGHIVGSTHHAKELLGEDLTKMTIGRIQQLMKEEKLFAAGRFQIIPETLATAIPFAGLGPHDLFDKTNQDKLGVALLLNKRAELGAYARAAVPNYPSTKRAAQRELSSEWASIPNPDTGISTYADDGANQHDQRITTKFVDHVLRSAHYESRALAQTYPIDLGQQAD